MYCFEFFGFFVSYFRDIFVRFVKGFMFWKRILNSIMMVFMFWVIFYIVIRFIIVCLNGIFGWCIVVRFVIRFFVWFGIIVFLGI